MSDTETNVKPAKPTWKERVKERFERLTAPPVSEPEDDDGHHIPITRRPEKKGPLLERAKKEIKINAGALAVNGAILLGLAASRFGTDKAPPPKPIQAFIGNMVDGPGGKGMLSKEAGNLEEGGGAGTIISAVLPSEDELEFVKPKIVVADKEPEKIEKEEVSTQVPKIENTNPVKAAMAQTPLVAPPEDEKKDKEETPDAAAPDPTSARGQGDKTGFTKEVHADGPGGGFGGGFGDNTSGTGNDLAEGIPLGTGNPQFRLIWKERADLDLYVIPPPVNGKPSKPIYWEDPVSEVDIKNGGAILDHDAKEKDSFPIENIFAPVNEETGKAGKAGKWQFYVKYHGGGLPVTTNFKVQAIVDGKPKIFEGKLKKFDEKSRTFDVNVPENSFHER